MGEVEDVGFCIHAMLGVNSTAGLRLEMTGTIQILGHLFFAGLTLGLIVSYFHDQSLFQLIPAGFCWFVFMFHFADAAWIATWGKGRHWVDRIGILIRGLGFASIAFGILLIPGIVAWILMPTGMIVVILGRAIWELALGPDLIRKAQGG